MIIDRLNNGGSIKDEYKLECALKGNIRENFKKKNDLLDNIKNEKDFDTYIRKELDKIEKEVV
jgi:hypothetical protein